MASSFSMATQATPIAEDPLCHDVPKGEDQHSKGQRLEYPIFGKAEEPPEIGIEGRDPRSQ